MSKKYTTQYDRMTQMPVNRLVLLLGAPTTVSMLVTTFYNMADTYFVGKLGTSATGAIGVVFALMSVIQALGFMLGQGSGSNISRLLGARNRDEASNFASTGFFTALLTGIVIAVAGLIFLDPMMLLIGSSDTILPFSRVYGAFILCATPAMMCSFVMNNILRFEGHASLAMIGLVLGGFLNVIGDWVTISILGMGIEGVGLSTMVSNYVSMLLLLSMFLRKKTQTRLQIKRIFRKNVPASDSQSTDTDSRLLHPSDIVGGTIDHEDSQLTDMSDRSTVGHILINIIFIGLPSLARQGLTSASTMVMNWMARPYGDAAIAAMSIVMRISFILFAVGLGIGQGFQPVSGFNYGAQKYDRVRKAALFTWGFSTVVMGISAVVCWLIGENLIALFSSDEEVFIIGTPALHYQLMSIILVPISFIGNMLFQSIGKGGRALFLSCLRSGLCYIPVLLILVPMLGLLGIQIAQPIADVLAAIITLPFFLNFLRTLNKASST